MFLGISSGIFATVLWALFPAFCKVALESMTVYEFLLLRYSVAFGLLAFLVPRVYKKRSQMSLKSWIMIATLVSLHNSTQGLCLSEVPVSWYILFFSCSPVLTYMIMPYEKTTLIYGCFILAIIGTLIFINPYNVEAMPSALSLLYLFVSVMSWAILTRVMSDFHHIYDDMEISCILNGSNLITAISLFFLFNPNTLGDIPLGDGLIPILVIGTTSPLAVISFSKSIRLLPSFGIASQYMELIFGILIGVIYFSEIPTSYQYVGMCFIILSLMGITLYNQNEKVVC